MQSINPILVFEQFGFVPDPKKETEKDFIGVCPFCHKTGHFGIKKESKQWNCFKCGRKGGFQTFLKTVVSEAREFKPQVEALAKQRRLSAETLTAMYVGWLNERWVLPVYSADGETILNIKIYDGESFKNTAGCTTVIYGLWAMPKEYDTVYLCEGEWDTLAMMEMITEERTAVIGVPGAGTVLKPEIINLFIGKSVYLLYDNDKAGQAGSAKTLAALTPVASEIRVLKWPETAGEGWDVRDVYVKDFKREAAGALEWIKEHSALVNIETNVQTPEVAGEHVDHELVYKTFGKWFALSDNKKYDQKSTDIYDVIFGMVFANRIPGDPVWLYLIAPPGGFKTEPLLSLSGGKLIEIHESVTAPALISGQDRGPIDPSLIPQFNGRLVIIKDGTVLLEQPEDRRSEIMSILRGAFDGECSRAFGNGIVRKIKSTFGIIMAVTPVIEQYTEEMASVGERFISWRSWIPEDFATRERHIRQAMDNTSKEQEIRRETNGISKRVLLSGYKTLPSCSDAEKNIIIKMSQWIAILRGTVARDKFRKNVLYKPFSEVATRLSKELYKLSLGISIFKGHDSVQSDTMRILKSIAWSNISTRYAETQKAFLSKERLTSAEAEKAVGLPEETMKIIMENMMMLGALEKVENMKWKIRDEFLNLTKGAKLL
jgi:CHC2 zinc finger/Toprim-like